MNSDYRIRKSYAADWCARIGTLTWPLLILAALGNRYNFFTSSEVFTLLGILFLLAVSSIILGFYACSVIWHKGLKGIGRVFYGFLASGIILGFSLIAAIQLIEYPQINDISSDLENPPLYTTVKFTRIDSDNSTDLPSEEEMELQFEAYPDIKTHYFQEDVQFMFKLTLSVIKNKGWKILDVNEPFDEEETGVIEAVATTLILGFKDDVVVRIAPYSTGSKVDIRSSSRWGKHDLGANAKRIQDFYTSLRHQLETSAQLQ